MKPIETSEEFEAALARLDVIFFAEEGTPEGDEAELLMQAIQTYDDAHFPIDLTEDLNRAEAEIDRGEFSTHEEVMDEAQQWISES